VIYKQISGVNLVLNLGVVDPGKKKSIFPGKLTKNFDFLGKNFRITLFSHLLWNVRLSRQICHLQL